MTDIVVGAFRFVINEPDKDQVGSILFKQLAQLMWGKSKPKGVRNLRERGLCIRPKNIEHTDYEADINSFVERLVRYQN